MTAANSASEPSVAGPFAIGAVVEMTGVSDATLRVWERRYGFPRSARTAGGHRQYMQEDVLRLRWVKLHMDAGMRAGRAIRAQSQAPRDATAAASLLEPIAPRAEPDGALLAAQAALLTALLAYDSPRAAAILDEARATYPLWQVAVDIVGPALAAIGEAWSAGEIAVATEHYASNLLRYHLLNWIRVSPEPFAADPIALACAPGELHEGGLLMLAVLLRQLRWPVIYLGQTLPLAEIGALCRHIQPALIVFAAMSDEAAAALGEWPDALAGALDPPLICYGGRAFNERPELAEDIPGTLLGATLWEGAQRLNRYMLDRAVLRK